ncbi:unnamed protein product, partial [Gulo gulo]
CPGDTTGWQPILAQASCTLQRWTHQRHWTLGWPQNAVGTRAPGANPFWDTSKLPSTVASACYYWGYARSSRSVPSSAMSG